MSTKTKKRVEQHEIGGMLRQVTMDYGISGYKYDDLAIAISKDFGVNCLASDVRDYDRLDMIEDYELEGRKQQYAVQSGFREVFQ